MDSETVGHRDRTCTIARGTIAAPVGVDGIASSMLEVAELLPDFLPLALASPARPDPKYENFG